MRESGGWLAAPRSAHDDVDGDDGDDGDDGVRTEYLRNEYL